MIIYREGGREVHARTAIADCVIDLRTVQVGDVDGATTALIQWGQVAAGLADALCPAEEDLSPDLDAVHAAGIAVARGFRLALLGDAGASDGGSDAVERVSWRALPATITLRVPEGFAYYALYPDAYAAAAERFALEERTGEATVVGLRSIGATLGAVVAATLEARGWEVRSLTVRPAGHPFERRPAFSDRLKAWLAERPGIFLIVDEGPGLSGSSICGTAEALIALGIAEERIVLMPAWLPDPAGFVSEAARLRWPRHRKVTSSFEEAVSGEVLPPGTRDISAGVWREVVYDRRVAWPASHPQHERRKSLLAGEQPVLFKFAGLGRHGAARHVLATRLADAGFSPPVIGLRRGFMASRFVPGRPLGRRDCGRDLVAFAARYFRARVALSPIREPVRLDELLAMMETNIRLGLGQEWLKPLARVALGRDVLSDAPAIAIDGRPQPHEWLTLPDGFAKTDAVDHHDDHFFPGPADAAWDVAGFAAEFALSSDDTRELALSVADAAPVHRLGFYLVAYLAFRLGYATMAEGTLGRSADGARFARLRRRYGWQLRRALLAYEAGA